jgi:hypothetical protein
MLFIVDDLGGKMRKNLKRIHLNYERLQKKAREGGTRETT